LERSGPRRTLFALITLLLPIALLGALEVVLRYAGVAAPQPLFVPAPEPGWLQPNERVIQRFFAAPASAPAISIDTAYFRASKEPGSFRAFVVGGSTAAGFPYGKWASLAGILEQRLQREHPGRTIEVIPVAMSAINTWSLADFTAEILAQSPDAVLVYAGHNEYLGVLGVGSAFGGGSPRVTGLVMQARRLRIVALALRLSGTLAERAPSGEHEPATLMARVAAERRIPFGSGLYQAGVAQFSANLDRLLGDYQGHGVPVFIATLVSNDRDQPPFMPVPPPGTAGSRLARALYRRPLAAHGGRPGRRSTGGRAHAGGGPQLRRGSFPSCPGPARRKGSRAGADRVRGGARSRRVAVSRAPGIQ
jgi:hypothetical protein